MPKRPRNSDVDGVVIHKKKRKYEKLQEKLEKLREELLSEASDSEQDGGGSNNLVVTHAEVHAPPTETTEGSIHLVQSDPDDNIRDDIFSNSLDINQENIINPLAVDENEISIVKPETENTELDLFGEDPLQNKKNGTEMLPNLAIRFNHSLAKGFDKELISKLMEKHPPAPNCSRLIPPILNPEIGTAFKNKDKVREDKFLFSMQETVAAGIMALYKETEAALKAKRNVEYLAHSTNLFLETYHKMSLHRRYLLSPFLNTKYKKMLEEQPIDKFLYGEDLLEKLKQTRASKTAALQVSSIMRPKTANFGSSTQRQVGGVSNSYRPQLPSSYRPDTRHLNYNVPSNKPRMKINNPPQNRFKNTNNYQSNQQWRTNRRLQ